MLGELRSGISVLIREPSQDPLDVGTENGITVIFAEPVFSSSMNAWQCCIDFQGNAGSITKEVYGVDALQALELAVKFAMNLYL